MIKQFVIRFATRPEIPKFFFATAKVKKSTRPEYNIFQALKLARSFSLAPYDESVEVCFHLNVDPKNGEQIVRGTCIMPNGLGKSVVVCAWVPSNLREVALAAGADMIGDQTVIEQVKQGVIKFEKCVAVNEMMNELKPLARVLGPRGLMPNQKTGNLVLPNALEQTIKNMKQGSVQFRVDKGRNIHCPLGKVSFDDEKIAGNLKSLVNILIEKKPPKLKGSYLVRAFLTTTAGPSWALKLDTVDPRSKTCLI